ncbi:MAG: Fic family protein [Polyangiaceae bacterium]
MTRTKTGAAKRGTARGKGTPKGGQAKKSSKKTGTPRVSSKKKAATKSAKKAASKKAVPKKSAKKAPAKKAAPKNTAKKSAKKAPVKAAKKASTKPPAKKVVAKPVSAKKASSKAKQAALAKTSAKKAAKPSAKPSAKKAATTSSAKASKSSAKKASAKKAAAVKAKATTAKPPAPKANATPKAEAKAKVEAKAKPKTKAEAKAAIKGALKVATKKAKRQGESRATRVVLTPRSPASVAPSIPIPVKKVVERLSLEQRAQRVEKRIQRQSTEFRQHYEESFEMSWIYHDTALEGIVYTFEELTTAFRSDEVTVVDSSVMPIYDAIRRHKAAIEFIQDAAEKKRGPVSVDFLKRLYIILHPEEGDPKTVKYRRDVPQHRLYFHEYAAPDKIAYKVRQCIDWVNNSQSKRSGAPLRVAAKAHYDLARAYPFTHDSGKVARLFMNFLLMRAGMPAAIIHATERQRYYEALKSPNATMLVNMLRDSVENAVSSIEKMLDEHETNKRGFVN